MIGQTDKGAIYRLQSPLRENVWAWACPNVSDVTMAVTLAPEALSNTVSSTLDYCGMYVNFAMLKGQLLIPFMDTVIRRNLLGH